MIYVFLADGFEETEAIAPIDMLRRAKLDVKLVGVGTSTPTSSHGIRVTADLTEAEVKLDSSVQLIVLPGGMPGTLNLEKSPVVQSAIKYCVENGIPVGAICAAPSILGKLGLLNGRKAVCFPGFEQYLTSCALPMVSSRPHAALERRSSSGWNLSRFSAAKRDQQSFALP